MSTTAQNLIPDAGWTLLAADATALIYLQIERERETAPRAVVEVRVAASAPAADARGLQLVPGDTLWAADIAKLGASGGLYMRTYYGPAVALWE